jgi:SNF2 family DNA or RNA helicase
LILPASLLGNWQAEINKFTPDLKIWIAHSSASNAEFIKVTDFPDLTEHRSCDHNVRSCPSSSLAESISWNIVVLDEAQSIKNPSAKQTQAIKKLKAKFALL